MYLYPIWIRLWHLFNAVLIIVLIVTGLSMQYTDKQDYILVVGFARAVKWHNIAAILLILNYVFFVAGNLLTANGKYYKLEKRTIWKDMVKQMKFYGWGMFRKEKHPFPITLERKFNPLQKFSYVLAMYVAMPLVIISGLGLLFPEVTVNRVFGVSGLLLTDMLHIATAFFLSVFLIIHIYTCTLGSKPTSLFRGMLSGYHESDEH
ncbi:MAG TPA: cytochrome B [Bacteroidales bacterium]|jgi:thiosulfate reductase cytochrome b subunit|nr:cytochrome B [Bacteroidales bacterium]HBZ20620.1 cytochrome B [Bacteroidales bacterium]